MYSNFIAKENIFKNEFFNNVAVLSILKTVWMPATLITECDGNTMPMEARNWNHIEFLVGCPHEWLVVSI